MVLTKIFVLDHDCGKDAHAFGLARAAEDLGKTLGKDIEILVSEDKMVKDLPRDYDIYLIHLSNTTEESIIRLRQEQPWSRIDVITGASYMFKGAARDAVDLIHLILLNREYQDIIERPYRTKTTSSPST